MKNAFTTLLALVVIISVMGVTVAAAASTTYAASQQPTQITITQHPPQQVKVGEDFHTKGQVTSGGTGLGNKLIYYAQLNTTQNKWYWYYNFTTNSDGSFDDSGHYNKPGTYQCRYEFWGDDQYAASRSDTMTITVSQ